MSERDEGISLSIGDLRQVIPMAFPDPSVEERFRARLASADDKKVSVRIAPPDEADVEGHAFSATQRSVWLRVNLDDDDTEGHAISVHFPTVDEAEKFRKRLMAAGLLTGAVVLGSVGAIAVSNLPTANVLPAPGSAQVFERPAGHGFTEGVDITSAAGAGAAAAAQSGINSATGKPARSGFLEGADGAALGGAAAVGSPAAQLRAVQGTEAGAPAGVDAAAATATGSAAANLRAVQGTEVGAPAGADVSAATATGSAAANLQAVQGTEAGAPSDSSGGASGGAGPLEGVDR
jgi:hypothetical protein